MKYKQLRKRQLVEAATIAMVLACIIGFALFLDMTRQDLLANQSRLQGEVSSVANETNGLRERFIRLQKDQDTYVLVMNLYNNDMLSHSTAVVEVRMKEYEDRYSLNSWAFDSTRSAQALDPSRYQRKTNVIAVRNSVIAFEATNDEDIFAMMRDIERDFPGSVSFSKFSMSRNSSLTDEALRAITQRGSYPLLKGEIHFSWFAIEPTDPEELKRRNQSNKRPRRRRA